MNRRGFLGSLGGLLAGATAMSLDPDFQIWKPGAKLISIPKPTVRQPVPGGVSLRIMRNCDIRTGQIISRMDVLYGAVLQGPHRHYGLESFTTHGPDLETALHRTRFLNPDWPIPESAIESLNRLDQDQSNHDQPNHLRLNSAQWDGACRISS